MKIKVFIFSIILALIIAALGIGIYCAWPAIVGTINDSKYYSSEDLQASYDDGYNDGIRNEEELTGQVAYYKEIVDSYYESILEYEREILIYQSEQQSLNEQIATLQASKAFLENALVSNQATIRELNASIAQKESEISELSTDVLNYEIIVSSLRSQITQLESIRADLEQTNLSNSNTIAVLNSQINGLNSQISELQIRINEYASSMSVFNSRISDLQRSIAYYEEFISNLETSSQVVATFEYDGSVYNIQILNPGDVVSVTSPQSTTYKVFNGWTVNNSLVDLSSYHVNENTVFVADITYKYDVIYSVEGNTYDSQITTKNSYAVVPNSPTKNGYVFDGWTVDGVTLVNPATFPITRDTAFSARFTQLFTVEFVVDNNVISTQNVRAYNYSNSPINPLKEGFDFDGWSVNDAIVNVDSYIINANTTFTAVFTAVYTVEFVVDGNVVSTQNVRDNEFATGFEPANTTLGIFDGWSVGNEVVEVSSYPITVDTVFVAKYLQGFVENAYSTISYNSEGSPLSEVDVDYVLLNSRKDNLYFFVNYTSSDCTSLSVYNYLTGFSQKYDLSTKLALRAAYAPLYIFDHFVFYWPNAFDRYVLDLNTGTNIYMGDFASMTSNTYGFLYAGIQDNLLVMVYYSGDYYCLRTFDLSNNVLSEESRLIPKNSGWVDFGFIDENHVFYFMNYNYSSNTNKITWVLYYYDIENQVLFNSRVVTDADFMNNNYSGSAYGYFVRDYSVQIEDNTAYIILFSNYNDNPMVDARFRRIFAFNIQNAELSYVGLSETEADGLSHILYNGTEYILKRNDFGYIDQNSDFVSVAEDIETPSILYPGRYLLDGRKIIFYSANRYMIYYL